MGLSIHYNGNLKTASTLKSLIEEVVDIAISNSWSYFIFEEKFKNNSFSKIIDTDNLYGIMLTPPECEPICFSFLSNGKICGIINYNVLKINSSIEDKNLYIVSTKTQYTGVEIHKKIVLIIDYISKKYLTNFKCTDEGKYWETRDETFLIKIFERYTNLVNSFWSSLEMIPMNDNESLENYLIRMWETINKNSKKGHQKI
jgi:hypothetical protein